MRKIVVFGGTFDPVHRGHLKIIEAISRYISPDQILIIPCGYPPHRSAANADGGHRLEMLRLACGEMPRVQIDDRELCSDGPSYSYLTLKKLQQENPDAQLFLALGWDSLVSFNTWHRWRDILDMACLLVVKRAHENQKIPAEIGLPLESIDAAELISRRIVELPFDEIDCSSTQIRQRLVSGTLMDGIVAPRVMEYIKKNNLYQS